MENKIINAINHIKFFSEKKPFIDRTLANLHKSDERTWEIEGLIMSLSDILILLLVVLYQCTFAANRHLSFSELHYNFPAGFYDYRLFYFSFIK